jgi:hypothetical protein
MDIENAADDRRTPGNAPMVSSSTASARRSSSTAVTCAPRSANSRVTVPTPGPISSTGSPSSSWQASIIARSALLLMRKCCPSDLLV